MSVVSRTFYYILYLHWHKIRKKFIYKRDNFQKIPQIAAHFPWCFSTHERPLEKSHFCPHSQSNSILNFPSHPTALYPFPILPLPPALYLSSSPPLSLSFPCHLPFTFLVSWYKLYTVFNIKNIIHIVKNNIIATVCAFLVCIILDIREVQTDLFLFISPPQKWPFWVNFLICLNLGSCPIYPVTNMYWGEVPSGMIYSLIAWKTTFNWDAPTGVSVMSNFNIPRT